MFSISRLAMRTSRQTPIARPFASAFSPGTFSATRSRPSNLSELRSFESLLQRHNSSYGGASYGGGGYGGVGDGGRGPDLGSRGGGGGGSYGSAAHRGFGNQKLDPTKVIYVGNLQFDIKEDDLFEEFKIFGNIANVKIIYDARGLSKGFGYIEFDSLEQSAAAIDKAHNAVFKGRRMNVQYVHRPQVRVGDSEPTKTLFIGNLSFDMSDADFDKLFVGIEKCIDVRIAMDRATGQPRGFAHADFLDVDSAIKAKEKLQGIEIFGRRLRVDYSDHKSVNNRQMDAGNRPALGQSNMGGGVGLAGASSNPDGSY